MTKEEKAALKYGVQQIRANPKLFKEMAGIEMTLAHMKLMENFAR